MSPAVVVAFVVVPLSCALFLLVLAMSAPTTVYRMYAFTPLLLSMLSPPRDESRHPPPSPLSPLPITWQRHYHQCDRLVNYTHHHSYSTCIVYSHLSSRLAILPLSCSSVPPRSPAPRLRLGPMVPLPTQHDSPKNAHRYPSPLPIPSNSTAFAAASATPRLHRSGQGLRRARHTTPYACACRLCAGCVRSGRIRGIAQVWKRTTHAALNVYVRPSAMGVEGSGFGGGRESGCDPLTRCERARARACPGRGRGSRRSYLGTWGTCMGHRA